MAQFIEFIDKDRRFVYSDRVELMIPTLALIYIDILNRATVMLCLSSGNVTINADNVQDITSVNQQLTDAFKREQTIAAVVAVAAKAINVDLKIEEQKVQQPLRNEPAFMNPANCRWLHSSHSRTVKALQQQNKTGNSSTSRRAEAQKALSFTYTVKIFDSQSVREMSTQVKRDPAKPDLLDLVAQIDVVEELIPPRRRQQQRSSSHLQDILRAYVVTAVLANIQRATEDRIHKWRGRSCCQKRHVQRSH